MYSSSPSRKASKGSVQVKTSNGRLQLVFSYQGKRRYISLGFDDTVQNRKLADLKARQIELDILSGNFDATLLKYRPSSAEVAKPLTPVPTPTPTVYPSLAELWEKYTNFKRPGLSPSTLAKDFNKVSRCINLRLPTKSLKDSVAIRDWLVANKTPNAVKRYLTQFSACCDWATKSQLIPHNPFKGMAADIKVPKGDLEETDINPFSLEERDLIIQAFRSDRYYGVYAPFIEFLFMTGCRPSEAVALQWQYISEDFRSIRFEQAVVVSESGLVCKKGLKTQRKRTFPVNSQLAALLSSIKPEVVTSDMKVFPSPEGTWIDVHNLTNRAWRSVLSKLDGIEYRKLYQARHTFITAALETAITMPDGRIKMLDAKDVAKLVGTSPKMIYEHYAGKSRELFVPEF
ncbi:site-specific integrase [Nodosilinea nodulosa]|uniref:site-specific integrase n=1 Tax=Nodosilinea nodulosa TaxID=416001 RepID=UPI0004744D4C|nr:site-specific integrase [Nodosilinea nodulosa]